MLNKVISGFLICLICLAAISPIQLKAQTRGNLIATNGSVKSDKKVENLDLKQFFPKSVMTESPIQLDTKKLEKENLNSYRKSKLTKGQKTALYIGIPAAIVATVIIIFVANKKKNPEVPGFAYAGCPGNPLCQ